jgi:hypothetical protein
MPPLFIIADDIHVDTFSFFAYFSFTLLRFLIYADARCCRFDIDAGHSPLPLSPFSPLAFLFISISDID